jgi:hypothetical protein
MQKTTLASAKHKYLTLKNGVTKKPQYNHSQYETFWQEHVDLGFTLSSCSFVEDNQGILTYIHEFLHQDLTGSLKDLDPAETDNIMFPAAAGRLDTKLKYRDIKTFTQDAQSQWHDLQK